MNEGNNTEKQDNITAKSSNDDNDNTSKIDDGHEKTAAMLAYLIFFLPLLMAKDSKIAMFHANQGLLLFLFAVIGNVIGGIIPVIGWSLILPVVSITTLVFFVLGIINASNMEMKELPLIGGIRLIK